MLGILGGMGPFASAQFLLSIYEAAIERTGPVAEQNLPRCLLDSDPGLPDRTAAVRAGHHRELATRLSARLQGLLARGASRVVLSCVTAHHFVDALDAGVRTRLISLVDVILDDLAVAGDGRWLMLATTGTREARLFERASGWPPVAHRVVLPEPPVQDAIHRLLYRLKAEPVTPELAGRFAALAADHGCRGLVAGCTEVHLLTRWWRGQGPAVVDPLRTIATDLDKLLDT